MIVKKILTKNFRAFAGTTLIELSIDNNKPFTIIIGDNGVGKTTICDAVTWCLFEKINHSPIKTIKNKDASAEDEVFVEIEVEIEKDLYKIKRIFTNNNVSLEILKNEKHIKNAENELRQIVPIFLEDAMIANPENLNQQAFFERQPQARKNFIFDLLFDSNIKRATHAAVINTFFKNEFTDKFQISIDEQSKTINIMGPNGNKDLRVTLGSGDIKVLNIYLILALHALIKKDFSFPIFFDSIFTGLGGDKQQRLRSLFDRADFQAIFLEHPSFMDDQIFKALNEKSSKKYSLKFSPETDYIKVFNL
jgi:AAA15 family ATPase/GTPase